MARALLNRRETLELSGVSERRLEREVRAGVIKPVPGKSRLFQVEVADAIVLIVLGDLDVPLSLERKHRLRASLHESCVKLLRQDSASTEHDDERAHRELALSPNLRVWIDDDWLARFSFADEYARFRTEDVESNPDVRGGEPVVRGTRVPVRMLGALLDQGESLATLREDYPHVPERVFRFAQIWDRTNPRRGRPRRPWAE